MLSLFRLRDRPFGRETIDFFGVHGVWNLCYWTAVG